MTDPDLTQLHATALTSGLAEDWAAFCRVLAGTTLIVPIDGGHGDTIRPQTQQMDGVEILAVYPTIDQFAEALETPGACAEVAGAELATMLRGQKCGLAIHADPPLLVSTEQLDWIASTFAAEVTRAVGAGVSVTSPALPELPVMEALGQAVSALGQDCPEAWLVEMTAEDTETELVLVLGLSDSAQRIEAQLAETITRTVQAATDRAFAVACPGRGSPLMDAARRNGVGVGSA